MMLMYPPAPGRHSTTRKDSEASDRSITVPSVGRTENADRGAHNVDSMSRPPMPSGTICDVSTAENVGVAPCTRKLSP